MDEKLKIGAAPRARLPREDAPWYGCVVSTPQVRLNPSLTRNGATGYAFTSGDKTGPSNAPWSYMAV